MKINTEGINIINTYCVTMGMKRPLFCVGLVLFISIFLASFLSFNVNVAIVALIFFVFLIVSCFFRVNIDKASLKFVLILLLTASFGFYSYILKNNFKFEKLLAFDGKEVVIDAKVISYPQYSEQNVCYDVKLNSIAGLKSFDGFRFRLYLKESSSIDLYDEFSGTVKCFSQYLSAPDRLKKYYKSNSHAISFSAYSDRDFVWKNGKTKVNVFYKFILDSRRYLKNSLNNAFSNNQSGLMIGMLLGDKTDVDYLTKRVFSLSGISHLLAVSGLHISILLQSIYKFLGFLKLKKTKSVLLVIIFTVFFVALTGFSPSAVRAGLMNVICALGVLLKRQSDSLNSLGIALIVVLLCDSFLALDVGLQLSFAATFGIILFQNKIYNKIYDCGLNLKSEKCNKLTKLYRERMYKYICSSLSVSVAALIFTMPITIVNFGQMSVIAPLTNVLLTPVVAPTLVFISLTAIFGGFTFFEWVYKVFALLSSIGVDVIKGVATIMSQVPLASVSMNKKYIYVWFVSVLILALVYKYFLKNCKIKKYVYLYSLIILLVGKFSNDVFVFGYVNFKSIDDRANYIIADTKSSIAILAENHQYLLPNIDDNMKLLGINHLDTVVVTPGVNVSDVIKMIYVYKPYKIISNDQMINLIKINLLKNDVSENDFKLVKKDGSEYLVRKAVFSKKMTELVVFDQNKILINNKNKRLRVF